MVKELELLTEKDILDFDKKIELIPVTFDFIFKGSFVQELPLLKKFLLSTLDTEIDIDKDCSITLLNNELPKENKKEYKKTVDVYIRLNDDLYINLEVNREMFKYVEYRNLLYFAKLCSMLLEKGEENDDLYNKTLIQININACESYNSIKDEIMDGTEKIIFCKEDGTQKFKNLSIISKYIDYYRYLYYNKGEKLTEGEMWLVVLSSQKFVELYETLGHVVTEEERDKFIRKVKNMCSEYFQIHEWEREKCDRLVESEKRRYQKLELEQKLQEGLERGLEQGKIMGIREKEKEIIKNMLENGFDNETISRISNLSIEEIIKIKETL